jgi:hypothetical protein
LFFNAKDNIDKFVRNIFVDLNRFAMEGRGHGSQDEGRNKLCFVLATVVIVEPLKWPSVTSFKRYVCFLFFNFQNVATICSLKGKIGNLEEGQVKPTFMAKPVDLESSQVLQTSKMTLDILVSQRQVGEDLRMEY